MHLIYIEKINYINGFNFDDKMGVAVIDKMELHQWIFIDKINCINGFYLDHKMDVVVIDKINWINGFYLDGQNWVCPY